VKTFKHKGVLAILYGPDHDMFIAVALARGIKVAIRQACYCYIDEQSIQIDVILN
jgi:hypothetical protein